MTYEEAKMQIQAIPEKIWDQLSEPDREAMEMAFYALQAQDSPKPTAESAQNVQNEDLISRKAAIDALVKAIRKDPYYDSNEAINGLGVCDVRVILNDLPSAQPELSDAVYQLWKRAYEAGERSTQPEIVRCHKCIYWNRDTVRQNSNDSGWWNEAVCKRYSDEIWTSWKDADWYCADAERRTE